MARPDPWQLDPASYPHSTILQTRFQDLDPHEHINNVAMAGMFESGRIRFNRSLGLEGWQDHRWLVARVEINYLAEAHFPADIVIAHGTGAIGNRSWHIMSAAFQDGEPIATCDSVIVMVPSGGATRLPDSFRACLERHQVKKLNP